MKILNQGFDHVEFVVGDLAKHGKMYTRMGFEKVGSRKLPELGLESDVWAQGFVRIILTKITDEKKAAKDPRSAFFKRHGDGICVLAIEVDDCKAWFNHTTSKGAKTALKPTTYTSDAGSVTRAEIYTPEDLRYAFVERKQKKEGYSNPALLDHDLVMSRLESPSPKGIRVIDHLTNNVDMGEMTKWSKFYQDVFGFGVTRHYKISTGRTGLISDVIQSPDHKIKVPINEATEKESQVQEFVTRFKGAGVQHLALLTVDLPHTLNSLRDEEFKFLTVPHTYYEAVPTRIKGVTEDLKEMERLGILLDGEGEGYLLQIFSEELVGPFFMEYIQRKGNQGFGEGNFKALFEAIERDQVRRGVL